MTMDNFFNPKTHKELSIKLNDSYGIDVPEEDVQYLINIKKLAALHFSENPLISFYYQVFENSGYTDVDKNMVCFDISFQKVDMEIITPVKSWKHIYEHLIEYIETHSLFVKNTHNNYNNHNNIVNFYLNQKYKLSQKLGIATENISTLLSSENYKILSSAFNDKSNIVVDNNVSNNNIFLICKGIMGLSYHVAHYNKKYVVKNPTQYTLSVNIYKEN